MWRFFEHHLGRTLVDPIEEAFFSTDSDDENARHLVRESIQNSLDARTDNQTVKMRFTFGELRDEFVNELFNDLPEHLSAQGSGLQSPPSIRRGIRFLAIEDFGTTGLVGDPNQLQDHDDDSEDNFFYFWRNVGRSGKRAGSLGRWGLGKTVFPASSRINTFFGLTRRPNDSTSYLLGRCDIKTHRIDGIQYDPYGYYASWDDGKPRAISDKSRIERFREAFHVARKGIDDTPGLSIIIPHVVGEFNVQMLKQEVIENYFWPILKGDLVIEVQEDYRTPPETTMDDEWMRGAVKSSELQQENRELADTIGLAAWAMDESNSSLSIRQPTRSTPRWDEETTFAEADLQRLMELDGISEPFAIQVPVWVQPKYGREQLSFFKLYGRTVPYTTRRKSYLVRQGIHVSDACATNPPHRIFIVVVETGPFAELLGSAENPSHSKFERTDAIRQRYRRGAMRTIGFVTGAPHAIVRILDRKDEDSVASLFGNIFWRVPNVQPPRPRRRRRSTVYKGETDEPTVIVEPRVSSFFLRQQRDGFQITDNPERVREIESITIKAGFEGSRGDPIKRHSKFDFDFLNHAATDLIVKGVGCEPEYVGHNEIRLQDIERNFTFQVHGFDTKRDLTVRATPRTVRQ
jgi:hypothetical protein